MKQKIPYHLFKDYIELTRTKPKSSKQILKYYSDMEKHAEAMREVLWEDIKKLPKETLALIPIAWLYDWSHITANYEYQDKIAELYDKHNLPKLTNNEFYKKHYLTK